MSVQSEINRILTNIQNSYLELASMGATIPSSQDTDHLVDTVRSLGGHFLDNYVSYSESQELTTAQKQTALSNIGAEKKHIIESISGCSIRITTGNATAVIQSVEYNGYCVEVGIQVATTTTINVGGNIQGTITMPEEYRPRRLSHDVSWGGSSCILARLRPNPDLYCQILSSQLASGVVFNLTFTYLI